MQKLRVGILGVSWWTEMVFPGFSAASNAEITFVAARNADKARDFASANGVPNWSADYLDLINSPEVDAVFVGVPNFLHEEMAIAALAKGKHVLQEKPMALNYDKSVAQARIAESRGLTLMVDQEMRLANGIRDLPEIIESRLGKLHKVRIDLTMAPAEWGGWRGDKELSGGTLFEMAIHELDLARWLFGRNPISVWAMGEDTAGHDVTVALDFGHGDSAVIDFCWRSIGFDLRVECVCEKGSVLQEIALPAGGAVQTIHTESGVERTEFDGALQGPETFKRVMQDFANACLTGSSPSVTAEDGMWAVRMAEGARASLRRGVLLNFQTEI